MFEGFSVRAVSRVHEPLGRHGTREACCRITPLRGMVQQQIVSSTVPDLPFSHLPGEGDRRPAAGYGRGSEQRRIHDRCKRFRGTSLHFWIHFKICGPEGVMVAVRRTRSVCGCVHSRRKADDECGDGTAAAIKGNAADRIL